MFLRTKCDKELFLSLHDTKTMASAGLPVPVKRPGIGVLSLEGDAFEVDRNDQLVRLFPGITRSQKGAKTYSDLDLESVLISLTAAPAIVLQGKFSIAAHKQATLLNIGLTAADVADVPEISDFIPDVLVLRKSVADELEILPDGSRRPVSASETRIAIDIFDVKHTSESNPSYCAEIAMYALMMANWLSHHPTLKDRFYVTMNAYLWTRFKQGDSALDRLELAGGASTAQLLEALVEDAEDANLRFYLAAVRRFFEDVVRVVRTGGASPIAWRDLEWHVSGTCGSCDWLGDKRHLAKDDKDTVDACPDDYCVPAAGRSGHLSLVPGMTRGAKTILLRNAVPTTAALAGASGHPALQKHTVLKRDAKNLPARSTAILSGTLSNDPSAVIASLVGSAHLLLYASVNFDSSAGLLTGLSLSGVATSFTAGQSPRRFPAVPYVVDEKTLKAEWIALEAFLSHIADCISVAEKMVPNPKGQVHFWEARQLEELCNAIGRHLPRVLALTSSKTKALAWLFAPEELIAKPDSLEAATVVTVEDIVRRMVFTPTPHVITLFDTAEHYAAGFVHTVRDSYYREYLSNGIPRERIYEIWSNLPRVKRGGMLVPRNTVISQFSEALAAQSKALESISERLRKDYKGKFKAKATHISTTVPTGATKVAFDGKLWIWADKLDFNVSQLEAHIRLAIDGERLEASYEAILLQNGVNLYGDVYEFDVPLGSREAKFKLDSQLTLGKLGRPGMPLEHATALLPAGSPAFAGAPEALQMPLWSSLRATLRSFDRVLGKAVVSIGNDDPLFFPYLVANASVGLLNDVFLLQAKSPAAFDWSKTSSVILKEIGNPPIAIPDQNAANAMGLTPTSRKGGKDLITPAARVLWDASTLERTTVVPTATASAVAAYVAAHDGLNVSQADTVQHAVERALTIIWGPPGTGKTNTVGALLHGLAQEASASGRALKILVTGPTYKAVEEVMERAMSFIGSDITAPASMFMGYSRGRAAGGFSPPALPSHLTYTTMEFDRQNPDYQLCQRALNVAAGVVIVGCQIRQARRFAELYGSAVRPVFDVVVIDESSQVPVSMALSALSGLKDDARLIIAGDHLQMPPITSIEAPADAAYLVGSIQTYLLERTFLHPVGKCILETNYRSADDIVAFARNIGYPSTLSAAFPHTALSFLSPLPGQAAYPSHLPWCSAFDDLLKPENKVVTLLHEDEVSSQGNEFEADMVAGAVWMLRQSVSASLDGRGTTAHASPTAFEFWDECVGIVTPHRAQRALVIRALEQLFPSEKNFIDGAVDTVERFQGGQRHTIIVTYGVADTDVIGGEEAFLMQLERTNVAVSRAMAKSIVVMPKTLAAYIPEDKKALATAFALKDYIEEFCNVRVDATLSTASHSRWAQVRYHR